MISCNKVKTLIWRKNVDFCVNNLTNKTWCIGYMIIKSLSLFSKLLGWKSRNYCWWALAAKATLWFHISSRHWRKNDLVWKNGCSSPNEHVHHWCHVDLLQDYSSSRVLAMVQSELQRGCKLHQSIWYNSNLTNNTGNKLRCSHWWSSCKLEFSTLFWQKISNLQKIGIFQKLGNGIGT